MQFYCIMRQDNHVNQSSEEMKRFLNKTERQHNHGNRQPWWFQSHWCCDSLGNGGECTTLHLSTRIGLVWENLIVKSQNLKINDGFSFHFSEKNLLSNCFYGRNLYFPKKSILKLFCIPHLPTATKDACALRVFQMINATIFITFGLENYTFLRSNTLHYDRCLNHNCLTNIKYKGESDFVCLFVYRREPIVMKFYIHVSCVSFQTQQKIYV